jgi:hypothetical protein
MRFSFCSLFENENDENALSPLFEFNNSDLPQGIYWLEVRDANQVFGEKILKNKSLTAKSS